MSTDINKEEAKKAIVTRGDSDPELEEALTGAHKFQLELEKEKNRHTEEMRGWFAKIFGQNDNATSFIATVGMVLGLALTAWCYHMAGGQNADFWGRQAERAISFSTACLAFIFGKGMSKS